MPGISRIAISNIQHFPKTKNHNHKKISIQGANYPFSAVS